MNYEIEKQGNLYRIYNTNEPQITIGYEATLEDASARIKELKDDKSKFVSESVYEIITTI